MVHRVRRELHIRDPLPPAQPPNCYQPNCVPDPIDNWETHQPPLCETRCGSCPTTGKPVTRRINPPTGSGGIHNGYHPRATMVCTARPSDLLAHRRSPEVGPKAFSRNSLSTCLPVMPPSETYSARKEPPNYLLTGHGTAQLFWYQVSQCPVEKSAHYLYPNRRPWSNTSKMHSRKATSALQCPLLLPAFSSWPRRTPDVVVVSWSTS